MGEFQSPIPSPDAQLVPTAHWRRRERVYAVLEGAPEGASYRQLIERVREQTGEGCSRKLISRWKKERTSIQKSKAKIQKGPTEGDASSQGASSPPLRLAPESKLHRHWDPYGLKKLASAAAIALALAGCSWLLSARDKLQPGLAIQKSEFKIQNEPSSIPTFSTTSGQTTSPLQSKISTRQSKLQDPLPRDIKIQLTLSAPEDLKVKPGDSIASGQVLSERAAERQRLESQRKQLELSLKKLEIPLPDLKPPPPIGAIPPLPPPSYHSEEANIKLKRQELAQAGQAAANQRAKLEALQNSQLKVQNEPPPIPVPPMAANPLSQIPDPLPALIEHETATLKALQAAQEKASQQLQLAQSQLVEAKQRRAQAEYQRYLEATQRAIALSQQQLERERQRGQRAAQLQERHYSQAQIQARLQEIDNALSQLGTVRAPYPGTIKKVKWTGQSDRTLSVELTLAVSR